MSQQTTAPVDRRHQPRLPGWKQLLSLDNRYIAPAFITCILLAGHSPSAFSRATRRRCWRSSPAS